MPTEKAMALASPGVPQGREEEMIAREQAALERPGNLRAAQALATAHRYLEDRIPAPCRLDYHLHGPAVGLVLHAEVAENAGGNRAERADVGEARTVERAHERRRDALAQPLLERERAPRGAATHARAEDQIGLAREHRAQHQRQFGRILVTVPVEEDEDVRVTGRQCAGQAGGAVATGRLPDNPGAGGGGDLRGAVGAAVVHDDDLVDEVARHLTDDAADRRLLVQGRDDDADSQVASTCARVSLRREARLSKTCEIIGRPSVRIR